MINDKPVFVLIGMDQEDLDPTLDLLETSEPIEFYISNLDTAIGTMGFLFIPNRISRLTNPEGKDALKRSNEMIVKEVRKNFDVLITSPGWEKSKISRAWVKKAIEKERYILQMNLPGDEGVMQVIYCLIRHVPITPQPNLAT